MSDTSVELTPEQKSAIARFRGAEVVESTEKTQEQIDEEKTEADKILADQEKEKLLLKEKESQPPAVVEFTDEQLLEAVAKRSGRKITSWDELKPKPEEVDREKEAERREVDKLSFGLKKGLFNKKQYEGYISDRQNPIGLVYAAELNEAKKDDPEWDEEKEKEFKDEFDTKFGLNLDQSSSKHKRGQKQLGIIADTILRNEYSGIYSLEGEYGKHESESSKQKAIQDKILAGAPIYKQDVQDAVAKLSTIEIPFGGDEKYEVAVPKEILDSISNTLMDNDFVASKITQGYTKEEIGQIAHTMAVSQNFAVFAHEAAKQYMAKHEKGVRGIPKGGAIEKTGDPHEGLTEGQKTALNFFVKPAGSIAN